MKKIKSKSILYLSVIFITYLIKAYVQFITPSDFLSIFLSEFFVLITLFVVFEFSYFIWRKYFKKIEETKFFKNINDSIETLFVKYQNIILFVYFPFFKFIKKAFTTK
jgi:hypothetical protein